MCYFLATALLLTLSDQEVLPVRCYSVPFKDRKKSYVFLYSAVYPINHKLIRYTCMRFCIYDFLSSSKVPTWFLDPTVNYF
jgi:hypothetical protein